MINYGYIETDSRQEQPQGDGWEFWGMRKTLEEEKAVWRRDADVYGELEK